MELKVNVDGIQRVVCGVTEDSTCQDVVVALAQAMGKTGRFTLTEKWRDNERPLLPGECPVKILQKWGEYAAEVHLLLRQKTDIQNTQSQKENEKPKDKYLHNFTPPVRDKGVHRSLTFSGAHNAVSDGSRKNQRYLQTGQSLDKHETSSTSSQPILQRHKQSQLDQTYGVGVRLKATQGGEIQPKFQHPNSHNRLNNTDYDPRVQNHSHVNTVQRNVYPRVRTQTKPDSQPSVSQPSVSQPSGPRTRQPQHRTEHHRVASPYNTQVIGGTHNTSQHPTYPHHQGAPSTNYLGNVSSTSTTQGNNSNTATNFHGRNNSGISILPLVQNQTRPSAFQPVVPQKQRSDSLDLTQPAQPTNISGNLPVYHAKPINTEIEEYDLDSNFPDILKDSRKDVDILKDSRKDVLIEEYTMPDDRHGGGGGFGCVNEVIEPDPQIVKMQRLVTMQQERIRMQESQLQLIDTELVSLEDEDRQRLDQKHSLGEEITRLQQTYNQNEAEVVQLDAVSWVDIIETEKTREKSYQSDILLYKSKLQTCNKDLELNRDKLSELDKQVEKETLELKECQQQQEKEKIQIEKDIEEVKSDLDQGLKTFESDSTQLAEVEEELKTLDLKKSTQQEEVDSLEKEIKEINIMQLDQMNSKGDQSGKTGKAVLQALEGRLSPRPGFGRKFIASPLSKVLSVSKNPNGVWV